MSRWKRPLRHVSFVVGGAITAALILTAALSLVYTPRNPLEMSIAGRLEAPSGAHPFGTDQYGRDLLSRVMAGAARSIVVGGVAAAVGARLRGLFGSLGGRPGGRGGGGVLGVGVAGVGVPPV